MMLGRDIQMLIDLMLGTGIEEVPSSSGVVYVQDFRKKLLNIHDIARDNIIRSSDTQKKSYDFKKNVEISQIGDTVFLHSTARKPGTSSKFHLPWSGPFLVVKKISDLVYGIQRSSKADIKYVHHDWLKPTRVKLDDWTVSSAADVVVELSDGVVGVDEKDSEGKVDVGLDSEQLNDDLNDVSLHQEDVPNDNVSFQVQQMNQLNY